MKNDLFEFFKSLDRSLFLDDDQKNLAAYDGPLPIGHGQTISQPSLVVQMTELIDLHGHEKVLEIGTGSGYQTAFLAEFSKEVYSIERIEELSLRAQRVLGKLNYNNISFKVSDGSDGWEEFAPFDRIIVTASASMMPEKLMGQLAIGGKLLVPIGPRQMQELTLIEKNHDGRVVKKVIEYVRFVEFVGEYGWEK